MPANDIRGLVRTRRIIYLLVATAIIVPYLAGMRLPFHPMEESRKVYNCFENLPAGSHVLIAMDFEPACKAELRPMAEAVLRHCFRKKLVPVVVTHLMGGTGLVDEICRKIATETGAVSGKDWVFLGFRPGWSNLVVTLGESIRGAFAVDFYGQTTQGMPALTGVNSLKDMKLMMDIALGESVDMWIQYGSNRLKIPFVAGVTAVMMPDMYPYLDAKQALGVLAGLRGAADYEKLLGQEYGEAAKGMQPQSVAHGLLIVLIVGANVRFLFRRAQGKEA
jgi:hypothetical protein